jgi:hypothetical protein
MKHIILVFLMVFLTGIVNAGTIDPGTSDLKYLAQSSNFTYVGQLQGRTQDNKLFYASAVAIDDDHILTAAHVIKDIKSCILIVNKKEYVITEFVYPPQFNEDDTFGYYDIALGYSRDKLKLIEYPVLYENNDEVGRLCYISGFGMTGTFNTGAVKGDNKQRAGSNIIDYIDRHLLICSPTIGKGKTSLEFIIASGDSGGGLFIDGKLAGINSCVLAVKQEPKSDYATECGHTRISLHLDWIKKHLRPK